MSTFVAYMRKLLSSTTGPRRLGYAAAAGLAALALPLPMSGEARGLAAWIVAATVDLGLAAWLASSFDIGQIRDRAKAQDESAIVLFLLMVIALCASVGAIVTLLGRVRGLPADKQAVQVTLSALAMMASWLWIHVLFAFHYAHRYYQHQDSLPHDRQAEPAEKQLALQFPGNDDPDYYDFLYFSLVIGMTSQVSDVQIASRAMRRIATVHALLAFAFNVIVVALGINALAGLLQ